MATVAINGKELQVFDRQAPGGLGRMKRVGAAEMALAKAPPEDVWDRTADLVRAYLVEDVGTDELLASLPADCRDILRACIVASGGKVAEPGEAAST